ncbi:MAG TPA: hypothetical protein VFP72_08810 [Kineosporiaceae bacterium]|nr:hypothetical protein [Kineosporiaceae bacterium]
MVRMGHDSPRAALKSQYATAQADRAIAGALGAAVRALEKSGDGTTPGERKGDDGDDGAAGVLAKVS